MRGTFGLRWWADVSLLWVCVRWFPALVPDLVHLPSCRVSLETLQVMVLLYSGVRGCLHRVRCVWMSLLVLVGCRFSPMRVPFMVSCSSFCFCLPAQLRVSL